MYFAAYFFGWMATATTLLIAAVVIVGVFGAMQVAQEKRRKQGAVGKKSKPTFYDQVIQEMTQFDEAVQRGLKRSTEQALTAADLTVEVWHEDSETEQAIAMEEPIAEEPAETLVPQRGFARALAAAGRTANTERAQRVPQTEQIIDLTVEEEPVVPKVRKARAAAAGSSVSVEVPQAIPPSWVGSDRP